MLIIKKDTNLLNVIVSSYLFFFYYQFHDYIRKTYDKSYKHMTARTMMLYLIDVLEIFVNCSRFAYSSLIDLSLSIKDFLKKYPSAFVFSPQEWPLLSYKPLWVLYWYYDPKLGLGCNLGKDLSKSKEDD